MITFEIEKQLAIFGTDGAKQLNIISWNGAPARLDLRTWYTANGEQQPGKGMTLTDAEAAMLAAALNEYLQGAEYGE